MRWLIIAAPLLASAALSAALLAVGWNGWTGEPDPCIARDGYYCEAFRPGLVAQPSNTWSCLAFVLVGLACAAHAFKNSGDSGRMGSTTFYPAVFSTAIALIGPASMALHASMKAWGGKVDGCSMDFFIAFALAFGLSRRFRWGHPGFAAAAALGTAAPVALKFIPGLIRGELVFGLFVAAFALNELLPEGPTRAPHGPWLGRAAGLFAAGFACWLPSVSSQGPLCAPASLLQGHAFWHAFTAMSAGAVYMHLRQTESHAPGAPA